MRQSEYEFTMELLSAMAAETIARNQKIAKIKAFDRFMRSETAVLLFDEESGLWQNGPDYIADEYQAEQRAKATSRRHLK